MIRKRKATQNRQARSHANVRAPRPERAAARPVMLAVLAFCLVFGGVLGVKLYQDWVSVEGQVEAERVRSAAFLSERVSDQIADIRSKASLATAQLEQVPAGAFAAVGRAAIDQIAQNEGVSIAAILRPGQDPISAGDIGPGETGEDGLRLAADLALDAPVLVRAGEALPIVLASPLRLTEGGVGVLVIGIEPAVLLPSRPPGEAVLLTDREGRVLAMQPGQSVEGAPNGAQRLGLSPESFVASVDTGDVLRASPQGEPSHIVAVSSAAGGPLWVVSVGPRAMATTAWRNTVIFYSLLFIAPFGTALALSILLRSQTAKLDDAQTRLWDSESRLRLAIESARCGVWDWDLDKDDVVLTDSFAQLIGRATGEVLSGPELLLLLREEDRGRVRAALRSTAQAQDVDVEVRVAGLAIWLQLRGRVMTDTNRIVGVAIDITERKGAQARVAAAESRLRAALESMTESFVLWDSRARLILWNRKFRDFFGFGEDVLRPGMSYEAVEAAAAPAIARSHAEPGGEAYDLELKDGRWIRYSERRTADRGLVSVGADITALKSQEAALKENDRAMRSTVDNLRRSQERVQELAENYEQEKLRAEEANRSKSEFLANMSHELRTPLNAINGFSEIMQSEMFGPLGHERYKDYVADILGSGQHLLSLINDILDMSKIEAGKMQLQPEPLEPSVLIEQCLRIIRARADEKSIAINVEGDTLPEIEADPRALKQVLLNLLSNAVKFTSEGGKVSVRSFDAADGIVLQVADNGIGISQEDLARVGRPFEQIESQHSKKHQGSGLGLALSKSLIEMQGGTLRIDSVLGKGTTVSFSLPAKAIQAEPSLGEVVASSGDIADFVNETNQDDAAYTGPKPNQPRQEQNASAP